MCAAKDRLPLGIGDLSEGDELDGAILRRLISADDLSSVWLTEPLEAGPAESCVRVIPISMFKTPMGPDDLCAQVAFWKELRSFHVVPLYHCGRDGQCCTLLMRYMSQGSAEDQADKWIVAHLGTFAMDLAMALHAQHAELGAHGNLKPTNVFPVRGRGVLLSDFLLPVWLAELDAGNETVKQRFAHPYAAPEQRNDPHAYDMRSDVYSFALVLYRCLTGSPPGPRQDFNNARWPSELAAVCKRCLERDPERRYADGHELLDALGEATGSSASFIALIQEDAQQPGEWRPPPGTTADRLDAARRKMDQGHPEEALEILEGLPADAQGLHDVLDEIERRDHTGEQLAQEAVRLASMGETGAALNTLAQAEQLSAKSATVTAMKRDLAADVPGASEEDLSAHPSLPKPLRMALSRGDYDTSRTLIEHALTAGPPSDDLMDAVRQFKQGRVRKAFLEHLRRARRLYTAGRHEEASGQWLEAARWLPSGPERERLRRIAHEAAAGHIRVEGEPSADPAGASTAHGAPAAALEPVTESEHAGAARRLPPAAALAILVVSVVGTMLLLIALLRR